MTTEAQQIAEDNADYAAREVAYRAERTSQEAISGLLSHDEADRLAEFYGLPIVDEDGEPLWHWDVR